MRRVAGSALVVIVATLLSNCAGIVSAPNSSPTTTKQSISLSPSMTSVRAGATQQFTASVVGISNPQLTWSVNNVVGGNSSLGVISDSGKMTASYTAPPSLPVSASVTIKATVTSNSSINAAATTNLLNPLAQLSSVSPSQIPVGSFSITLSGTSFVSGAVVNFGSNQLPTNFVSSSELTATGTATTSEVGSVEVTVANPNPGSTSSNAVTARVLAGKATAPQISVSPTTLNVPTGATVNANLTVTGSPSPTVACTVSGAGTAQLSGSTVSYTAPKTLPAGDQATVACIATNGGGSASASIVAKLSTVVPIGYAGPIPSTYFGMHLLQPTDWPTVPIGALGKLTGALWPYVEPSKGQYNWARLDQYVEVAQAQGVSLMYSNDGVPPWAAADPSTCFSQPYFGPYCSGTVANIQDWDDFVTALATRYKGKIQIYELWNEPEHSFTGTMTELVAITQNEHDIIRSVDPSATILSPSMVSQGYPYLDSYFATGGTVDVDAIAIHTYPDPTNDVAESITMSITTTIKTVMGKYALSTKPIWGTEGSWGPVSAGDITDLNLRTAFVAREFLLSWPTGISRFYWYAWDSPDVGTLWTVGPAPSAPAIALGQVYGWLTGATMPQPCSLNGASSAYHAIYTCSLTRSGNYQAMAVWNTDGSSTYTVPTQFLHYKNLQGNVIEVPANHQVTIGLQPILLENN